MNAAYTGKMVRKNLIMPDWVWDWLRDQADNMVYGKSTVTHCVYRIIDYERIHGNCRASLEIPKLVKRKKGSNRNV
jgi:hypothetical protein